MANRRMFARTVIESGEFFALSNEAKVLYFYMGMQADDDGFAYTNMTTRALDIPETAVEELVAARLVERMFDDKDVYHINHWRENNQLRKDRHTPSQYSYLLDDSEDDE